MKKIKVIIQEKIPFPKTSIYRYLGQKEDPTCFQREWTGFGMAKIFSVAILETRRQRTNFQYVTKKIFSTWNAIHNQTNVKTHFQTWKISKNTSFSCILFQKINGTYLLPKWRNKPRRKAGNKSYMGSNLEERRREIPEWWWQAYSAYSTLKAIGDVFAKNMKLVENLMYSNVLKEIFAWEGT